MQKLLKHNTAISLSLTADDLTTLRINPGGERRGRVPVPSVVPVPNVRQTAPPLF